MGLSGAQLTYPDGIGNIFINPLDTDVLLAGASTIGYLFIILLSWREWEVEKYSEKIQERSITIEGY